MQLGNEEPIASMDSSGKMILARHNEISAGDLKQVEGHAVVDGERPRVPESLLPSPPGALPEPSL